jgi:arylsulfatase A-like enzyme
MPEMTRRDLLALPAAAAASVRPPNIVVLLADDLGWHDVSYHGSEIRTPHIDRLAGQGVRFERFCAFPLCSPTRSALMTGRNPIRFGVVYATIEPFDTHGVPVEEHFFSETLRAAGYETAVTGKWHLGHTHRKFLPPARGFEHSYGHLNGRIDYYTKDREGGYDWHRDCKTLREEGYSTELIAREAVRLIEKRDRARPLFLYVPFNAPHAPLEAPPRYMDHYAKIADQDRRTYAAMVEYMDDGIGRILGALDSEGMARDTLVFFFSDNGGQTGQGGNNHPLRGAKRTTYEGGLRVPAVMRWPGKLPAGAVSRQLWSVMDVFPTFCAAVGVAPRNRLPFDGRNLWPVIAAGRTEPRRNLFFCTGSGNRFLYALCDAEWKLVRTISRQDGTAANELFRVEEDETEQKDLAAQYPQVVKDLAARVDRWRALYPKDGIFEAKKTGPAPKQWAEAAL